MDPLWQDSSDYLSSWASKVQLLKSATAEVEGLTDLQNRLDSEEGGLLEDVKLIDREGDFELNDDLPSTFATPHILDSPALLAAKGLLPDLDHPGVAALAAKLNILLANRRYVYFFNL